MSVSLSSLESDQTLQPAFGGITGPHVPGMSRAERRTLLVAALSAVTMAVEVVGGLALGSMALLADGLHMASHTFAMGVAVVAYRYARRHATNPEFVFGTGKVNALGGYTGATVLIGSAIWMIWESVEHAVDPGQIHFTEAAGVAAFGLVVNGISAWMLRDDHSHHGSHDRGDHDHGCNHSHDHNLRAAYLHVVADAATSILAIIALLAASYWGLAWLDPLAGIVGAVVVGAWAVSLLKSSSHVLLDRRSPEDLHTAVRGAVEQEGTSLTALRCWSVGPGRHAAALRLRLGPGDEVPACRARLASVRVLAWISVEVDEDAAPGLRSDSASSRTASGSITSSDRTP